MSCGYDPWKRVKKRLEEELLIRLEKNVANDYSLEAGKNKYDILFFALRFVTFFIIIYYLLMISLIKTTVFFLMNCFKL